MCFTVSLLLADGETVAGMDLNFSKAQESILRMTRGREQTAMIVTSGGLIAGYTDMSLVGARADEKLPEYAEILRRVASSNDHDSFRVEMDGRPCVIINHPNSVYQMSADHSVSVQDTEYAEACGREGVVALRDYAGRRMACLSRKADSGFTVVVAERWWDVYGAAVVVTLIFLLLFGFCLVIIISMINRLIRWQEDVNHRLVDAAEAAQSANRAKSQFLSQMSHEIRTPMNAIIGLDVLALRDPDISPRTRGQLEKIDASARHLLSLINDILDMSRIESGRMTLNETEFSFRTFMDQISVIINGQCAEKGLRFACEATGFAEGACFRGDDLKLKQVLINILGNAVKFTEPPGTVSFTVERFRDSEAGRFDAILMDMRMPVMDGLAATRAIRALERPDARTVPIVALTANAFEENVQQCLQAGMNAHLSKPVDVDRLQETLGRLLAEAEA